jgi:hypothetical protein
LIYFRPSIDVPMFNPHPSPRNNHLLASWLASCLVSLLDHTLI